MSNTDAALLRYIIDAIEQVERYTRGMSESEFLSRSMVQDATVRQIEIISAAACSISPGFQNAHPKLAWSKMIGLHRKIVPEIFSIDPANLWNTVQDDLPPHKQAIKKII
ncbi:MAG: DUF86 domain-containing protein [Anaerolineales bacterium]|nr:DUF86 domain-containing protein [Anaerolineales bacterium]